MSDYYPIEVDVLIHELVKLKCSLDKEEYLIGHRLLSIWDRVRPGGFKSKYKTYKERERMAVNMSDRIEELEAKLAKAVEALEFARPLVEKWCHYQGDHPALFSEYLSPIDTTLAELTGGKDE